VTEDDDRWIVQAYRTTSGHRPVRSFIDSLERRDQADALALVKLAEERGNQLREPQSKALGDGLYELRGKQVRIFYVFGPPRRTITLLSGIVKKQDRVPETALAQARRFKVDLEARAKKVDRA
jgi:hypothetical protein